MHVVTDKKTVQREMISDVFLKILCDAKYDPGESSFVIGGNHDTWCEAEAHVPPMRMLTTGRPTLNMVVAKHQYRCLATILVQ